MTDHEGGLWFSGDHRVYLFENGHLKAYSLAGFKCGTDYQVAYKDHHGGFWVRFFGTLGNSYSLLRIKDEQVREVRLPGESVSHFAEDAQGNLWLSIYHKGIFRMNQMNAAFCGSSLNIRRLKKSPKPFSSARGQLNLTERQSPKNLGCAGAIP